MHSHTWTHTWIHLNTLRYTRFSGTFTLFVLIYLIHSNTPTQIHSNIHSVLIYLNTPGCINMLRPYTRPKKCADTFLHLHQSQLHWASYTFIFTFKYIFKYIQYSRMIQCHCPDSRTFILGIYTLVVELSGRMIAN